MLDDFCVDSPPGSGENDMSEPQFITLSGSRFKLLPWSENENFISSEPSACNEFQTCFNSNIILKGDTLPDEVENVAEGNQIMSSELFDKKFESAQEYSDQDLLEFQVDDPPPGISSSELSEGSEKNMLLPLESVTVPEGELEIYTEKIAEFRPLKSVDDLKRFFPPGSKVVSITEIQGDKEPSYPEDKSLNLIRSNPGQYTCKLCGSPFSKQYLLTTHMKMHKTEENEGLDLRCEYVKTAEDNFPRKQCDARDCKQNSFMTINYLETSNAFTCEICAAPFAMERTLTQHMRQHGINLTYRYFCTSCKRDYSNKKILLEHVKKCIPKKSINPSVIKTKGANGSDQWFIMYT